MLFYPSLVYSQLLVLKDAELASKLVCDVQKQLLLSSNSKLL